MKLNDKLIQECFDSEPSLWQSSDLDWLDQQYINSLTSGGLELGERERFIEMVASDAAVAQKYRMLISQNITETAKEGLFGRIQKAIIKSVLPQQLGFIVVLLMVFSITYMSTLPNYDDSEDKDQFRSAGTMQIYPTKSQRLASAPDYLQLSAIQQNEQKVELLNSSGHVVWKSQGQINPRFYIPEPTKNKITQGTYHWHVIGQETFFEFVVE